MSLIFYNPHAFKKLNKKYNDSVLFDIRRNTCKISRVDLWNLDFFTTEIRNLYPMFDYNTLNDNLSFQECLERRVMEIVNQNNRIHIYWSGGMDSCVVVLAFLQFVNVADVDIEVFMTSRSKADFPEFFEQIIEPHLPYTIEDDYDVLLKNNYHKDVLNVSGDGAEEVVGWSGELSYSCRPETQGNRFHLTHMDDLDPSIRAHWKWLQVYQEVKPTLRYSPIKIQTVYDLNWWIRLNFDYQYASMRFGVPYVEDISGYERYNIPFFLTDYFFEWSIKNYVPLRNSTDYNHYDKMPWKEYMSQFFDGYLQERIFNMQRFTNVEYQNYVAMTYFGYQDTGEIVPLLPELGLTDKEIAQFEGFDNEEMLLLYD